MTFKSKHPNVLFSTYVSLEKASVMLTKILKLKEITKNEHYTLDTCTINKCTILRLHLIKPSEINLLVMQFNNQWTSDCKVVLEPNHAVSENLVISIRLIFQLATCVKHISVEGKRNPRY